MTLIKTLLACLILLGLHLPAVAAADPAQYRLTEDMLRKLQATDAEAKKMAAASRKSKAGNAKGSDDDDIGADQEDDPEDEDDDRTDGKSDKDDSVEGMVRKIEADPRLKALLARHGISSLDYAMSMHAMLHAGMYLMFESSMPKPKAAELFSGYTKAQQANIDLLRKSAILKK
jgi:hypothetical protein